MFKKNLVIIFFLFWVALAINPVDRGIWALENILVVTVFPVVLWLDDFTGPSVASFLDLLDLLLATRSLSRSAGLCGCAGLVRPDGVRAVF